MTLETIETLNRTEERTGFGNKLFSGMRLGAVLGLAILAAAAYANAQAIPEPVLSGKLIVGGASMSLAGPAKCTRDENGSIYDVPAAVWITRQDTKNGSVSLSVFRLKNGTDMFSLYVSNSGSSYKAANIKVGTNGTISGSGKVSFAPAGTGGTFTVDVTASNGKKVTGTIACSAFLKDEAEGGR